MCKLANRYVAHAALPNDWSKADIRAIRRFQKTMNKINAQLESLSNRGVLVEIRRLGISGAQKNA